MAESKVSKSAATKKKTKKVVEDAEKRRERKRMAPTSRRWVPPVFIAVGLLGGLWLVTYYIAGNQIPFMSELGDWNVLIGMGLMATAFAISTLWK